jgi:hypothetical protein
VYSAEYTEVPKVFFSSLPLGVIRLNTDKWQHEDFMWPQMDGNAIFRQKDSTHRLDVHPWGATPWPSHIRIRASRVSPWAEPPRRLSLPHLSPPPAPEIYTHGVCPLGLLPLRVLHSWIFKVHGFALLGIAHSTAMGFIIPGRGHTTVEQGWRVTPGCRLKKGQSREAKRRWGNHRVGSPGGQKPFRCNPQRWLRSWKQYLGAI